MDVIIYAGIAQTTYEVTCSMMGIYIYIHIYVCILKCVQNSQVSLNFYSKIVSFFWLSLLRLYHFNGDTINCCLLRRKTGLYLM